MRPSRGASHPSSEACHVGRGGGTRPTKRDGLSGGSLGCQIAIFGSGASCHLWAARRPRARRRVVTRRLASPRCVISPRCLSAPLDHPPHTHTAPSSPRRIQPHTPSGVARPPFPPPSTLSHSRAASLLCGICMQEGLYSAAYAPRGRVPHRPRATSDRSSRPCLVIVSHSHDRAAARRPARLAGRYVHWTAP